MESDQHNAGSQAAQPMQQQGYDYSAYYHYYQQNPEAWAQYMAQWQQYQQASANPTSYSAYPYQEAYQGLRNVAYQMNVDQMAHAHMDRQERMVPSTTLWVGNLPWDCTEQDIRAVFEIFGRIRSIRILSNKNCAFVTYYDLDASTAAHYGTFGLTIKNSPVKVGWGKAQANDFMMRTSGSREDNVQPSPNIWVGQLDPSITEEELRAAFRQFGVIERIRVLPARNCAFINFAHLESAIEAKDRMNGTLIRDQPVRVNYGKQREERMDKTSPTSGGNGSSVGPSNHPSWSTNIEGNTAKGDPDMRHDGNLMYHHHQIDSRTRSQPPPTPPPPDVKDVIDKLVDSIVKKGPELEAMVREKQANNPRFAFLKDGPGSKYYHWKLDQARRKDHYVDLTAPPITSPCPAAKADQNLSTVPPWEQPDPIDSSSSPPPVPSRLSPGEEEELLIILGSLSQTREKIESAADWVFRHRDKISSISSYFKTYFLQRADSLSSCVNVLYVVNESLQTGLKVLRTPSDAPQSKADKISTGFLPHLSSMIRHMKTTYGEHAGKINELLTMWKDKGIYSPAVIDSWIYCVSQPERPAEPTPCSGNELSKSPSPAPTASPREESASPRQEEADNASAKKRSSEHLDHTEPPLQENHNTSDPQVSTTEENAAAEYEPKSKKRDIE
ncbi:uncharacterized protein LOC126325495 [Schistocerca gregaria]|uniref:uncharacterized protein LOC126325495 n=1 Tax=Schistocerca gregaria TaxID=7010 RepID=UPI00211DB25E|nr:uncharacterized protein LOC126325495 [Schistocerca gregaria]